MAKKMTPKQRVLEKWPRAFYLYGCIYRDRKNELDGTVLGCGFNAREAWADAARRLK